MYKGIGYILHLLKISPSDLGHYLNVDRTLVSKWKNGSRTINYYSDYFDKLLDYILLANKKLGVQSLEHLFDTDQVTNNELRSLLKTFIINNEYIDTKINSSSIDDNKYTTQVTIYRKVEDRNLCNQIFFDTALNLDKCCKITLIYTDVLDISKTDSLLLKQWYNNILKLLKKHFIIDLIVSPNKNPLFMYYCSKLMLHDKCMTYLYADDFNKHGGFSLEIIEDKLLVFGLPDSSHNPLLSYYSVYEDAHSIYSFSNLAVKIKLDSKLLLKRYNLTEFIQHNNYYDIYIPRSFNFHQQGNAYSISPYPNYLFMNEQLFIAVLKNSKHTPQSIERELAIYRKYRPLLIESYKTIQTVSFLPIDNLNEYATLDTITYTKQNNLLSPALILTNAQYKEHLNDVAEFLLSTDSYSICLYSGELYPSFNETHCWCKKNQSIFMFNLKSPTNFVISENTSLVNHMITLFENKWATTDNNLKNIQDVINVFQSM